MKPTKLKSIAYLVIFHTQRVWGGNEEGGWWYYVGERQCEPHFYDVSSPEQEIALQDLRHRVQRALDSSYEINKRELSSVLSEGMMTAEIWRDWPPKNYPEQRPHYE
jgi:hypothetical protein